jgi:DNA-binding GntR family transcriptional regulator
MRTQLFEELGSSTLSARIARLIEEAIMKGSIMPGQRLSTDGLARDFKVSHIPVREALKQLEAQGMVIQEPNKGARVVSLSKDDIKSIFEVRETLEGLATAMAAERIDDKGKAHLQQIVDKMRKAMEKKDYTRLLAADKQFHQTIWKSTGNSFLVKALSNLLMPYFGYLAGRGYKFHIRRNEAGYVPRVHQSVCDAIVSGKAGKARQLMTQIHARALSSMLEFDGASGDGHAP